MKQQRELLHYSEQDENLHRSTGVRGETRSWQEETCHWMFWEQLYGGCTGRHSGIWHTHTTFLCRSLLKTWLVSLLMSQQFNQDSMGRKTFDCSWRENVLKANAMKIQTLLGVLKRFWLVSWAFFFLLFFLKYKNHQLMPKLGRNCFSQTTHFSNSDFSVWIISYLNLYLLFLSLISGQ